MQVPARGKEGKHVTKKKPRKTPHPCQKRTTTRPQRGVKPNPVGGESRFQAVKEKGIIGGKNNRAATYRKDRKGRKTVPSHLRKTVAAWGGTMGGEGEPGEKLRSVRQEKTGRAQTKGRNAPAGVCPAP